ncbi:hypothetical protein GCM10027289_24370 [Tsukamurella serpentis]
MNVLEFFRWALRKPVIIVIVLVCALLGAVQGYRSTTSTFETAGAVVVIPPGAGNTDAGLNPFVNLSQGTAQIANILATGAQSDQAREAVAKTGASAEYVITSMAGEGSVAQLSSQITFVVSGPDQWKSKAGAIALIDHMRAQLRSMQQDAGVVDGTMADLRVPTEPSPGTEVGGNPLRAAVGLAMGAALLALLLCLVVTAVLESRRRRTEGAERSGSSGAAGPMLDDEEPSGPLAGLARRLPSRVEPGPKPPGRAAQRALTRWREHVEEVPEDSEIPLPDPDAENAAEGAAGIRR